MSEFNKAELRRLANPQCSICKGEGVFYEHSTVETCWCSLPSRGNAERKKLAELEAVSKDAERYRWLLENALSSYSGEHLPVLVCGFDLPADGWRDEVSRRIDAAISREVRQ